MQRFLKITAVPAALWVLGACGSGIDPAAVCDGVLRRAGVQLDIKSPLAAKVGDASMKVCVDGSCRTSRVRLDPMTTPPSGSCSGGDAGNTCASQPGPTGERTGSEVVRDLPKRPVRVSVVLRDASGTRILDQTIIVNPKDLDGPRCPGDPQAKIVVADGRLRDAS
jgi:hypothetical protein